MNSYNSIQKQAETHSTEEVVAMLKRLRLSAMAECLAESIHNPQFQELGLNDQLYELIASETTKRTNNSYERLKKKASLFSCATRETVVQRKEIYNLSPTRIDYLTSCIWREKDTAIIIVGKCGCGKTDLGCAIVDSACRKGLKAQCIDFDNLILDLVSTRKKTDDRDLYREAIQAYCKNELLFIDDICMEETINGAAYVFKDLLDHYRKKGAHRGLILASQLKPPKWCERLGGTPETSEAVVDRVLSNYELIQLEVKSHRSGKPNNVEHQKTENDKASEKNTGDE